MIDVYQKITDKMIEQLEQGIIPWHKPWSLTGCAVSHTNGKPYSVLNQYLLEGISGEWLTFNQIQKEGGHIKAGEKAHFVVFWSFIKKYKTDENGENTDEVIASFPMLKSYNVWHISQCEGIKEKYPQGSAHEDTKPIERCEEIAIEYSERSGVEMRLNMECNRAFYDICNDYINVPNIKQFAVVEEYYSTLFHEMTHSTGAAHRLNREGIVKFDHFGGTNYSKEELVAEMGAAFLCNASGLDAEKSFDNSVAYVQSWLKALKNDKKLVVAAATKAEQAVKFILTGEKPNKDE